LDDPLGPVVDVHGTDPPSGGVTAHVAEPVGVGSPTKPPTAAVNVSAPPADTAELFVTVTDGVIESVQVSPRRPCGPSPPKSTS
jgi:hypothetical protein